MTMINDSQYIRVGEIYREHGVKGVCKFYCYSSMKKNLRSGESYVLQRIDGEVREVQINHMSASPRFFLVHFDIFNTPESIVLYRKATLWLPKTRLKREKGEFFDDEFIGLYLKTTAGETVGIIKEVIYNPLRQMIVSVTSGLKKNRQSEIMIPYVRDWFVSIDLEKKEITINLPDGLYSKES
ncbi:MAG: 16S rRNA processing protein RimM [Deltaproteobacteria bacterium]|nr:16S rRNA processing protein RimM [Deltaproteobacteria bacterium]